MNTKQSTKALGIKGVGTGVLLSLGLWGCAGQPAQNETASTDTTQNSTTATTTENSASATGTVAAEGTASEHGAATEEVTKAVAVLHPTKGNNIRGTVTFTMESGGIRVIADITGLKPGKHGFHVHQNGDCSAPDAASAGGHFNPTNMPHAGMDADQRHIGDLGNVNADATGKARYDRLDTKLAFEGSNSIIGRAVIVHAGTDDLKSQPSGDAGGRGACGVVGVAQPAEG